MQGIPPGCTLQVQTDATSTAFCLQNRSKVPGINQPIAQQCKELAKENFTILPTHIRGVKTCRADWMSRNPDPTSFALSRSVFLRVCRKLQTYPELDLFANRKNRQTKKFCSWRTDPESLGNAFHIHWGKHLCWINPPWELMPQVLKKVRQDQAQGILVCPVWTAAHWWREVQELRRGPGITLRGQPIFRGPGGQSLPPPAWATLFTMVSGSQP